MLVGAVLIDLADLALGMLNLDWASQVSFSIASSTFIIPRTHFMFFFLCPGFAVLHKLDFFSDSFGIRLVLPCTRNFFSYSSVVDKKLSLSDLLIKNYLNLPKELVFCRVLIFLSSYLPGPGTLAEILILRRLVTLF